MISFFPTPYLDEVLYGLISRYHRQSGNIHYWQTIQELFGNKRMHSSVVLPNRLGALASQTNPFGLAFDELLIKHTLYPYYTAFASVKNAERDYIWAKNNFEGPSVCYHMVTFGNQIHEPRRLRFCPQCYAEEQENLGEGYWHRIQQTPGVLICERHHCVLLDSTASYLSKGSNKYLPATVPILFPTVLVPTFSDKGLQQAIQIVCDMQFLYNNYDQVRAAFSKHTCSFRTLFIHLLQEKGLVTEGGALRLALFRQAFLKFYASELLEVLGLSFDDKIKCPWIVSMCRNDMATPHPLRYILLARFLCGGLSQLIRQAESQSPAEMVIMATRRDRPIENFEDKLTAYRKRWSDACRKIPGASQNEIRKTIPHVYTWLNRHDKAWLVEHPKERFRRGGNKSFSNWGEKDFEYSSKVPSAAEKIRRDVSKPVRITKTKLLNAIGCGYLPIEKQKLLTQTEKAIMREVETTCQFQLRRVIWAVDELTARGEPLVKWRILKLACIRSEQWDGLWMLYQNRTMSNKTIDNIALAENNRAGAR